MKHFSEISLLMILIGVLLTVQSSPLNSRSTFTRTEEKKNLKINENHENNGRVKRQWFARTTKATMPPTSTLPPPNDLEIGVCKEDDKLIYYDDTRIESNNATLTGVIEIYIDSPYFITCCKIFDQLPLGTGAFASFNNATVDNGGPGHKFMKIDVVGQLGHGMHFKVFVYGTLRKSEINNL